MPDGKVLSGIFGFNAFEQFLRTDAVQLGQGQQVGGAGVRVARFPNLKILLCAEILRLITPCLVTTDYMNKRLEPQSNHMTAAP